MRGACTVASELVVVTLNLWGDREPLARRLDAAAAQLRVEAPDVLLLQEVRVDARVGSTAESLAERLGGYHVTYACATAAKEAGVFGEGSIPGEEGLAILSRKPPDETRVRELPEARPNDRRILLSARVGGVFFHTTHLHWRLTDGVARERQVADLDEAIRSIEGDVVHVLGGDFNAAPDCDEIRFLTGRHTLFGRRTYWQDAFARANPGDAGWTWASRNPNTEWLRWLELDRRIDYIFVSMEKRDGRGRVLGARVILDAPGEGGVYPSDHFAVMARIRIAP